MKRHLIFSFLALAALTIGTSAYAHHSFAATYREKDSVTIEGELVQLDFRNPHSFVHLDVTEKDGTKVRYAVEWGGVGQLGQQGSRVRRSRSATTSSSPAHRAATRPITACEWSH